MYTFYSYKQMNFQKNGPKKSFSKGKSGPKIKHVFVFYPKSAKIGHNQPKQAKIGQKRTAPIVKTIVYFSTQNWPELFKMQMFIKKSEKRFTSWNWGNDRKQHFYMQWSRIPFMTIKSG